MLQTLGPTTTFKHSKTKSLCCNITLLFAIHPHPFCQRPLVLQHYTTRTEPNRTAMSHEPNRTEPPCHANRDEPACWWTEPPLFEVSTNRNEPKRTEAFLYSACFSCRSHFQHHSKPKFRKNLLWADFWPANRCNIISIRTKLKSKEF